MRTDAASAPWRRILAGPLAAPPADLLRALAGLKPRNTDTLSAILNMLGHQLAAPSTEVAVQPPAEPRRDMSADRSAASTAAEVDGLTSRNPIPSRLTIQEPEGVTVPDWLSSVALLPLTESPGAVFEQPMPPLLTPGRERALLGHAAAQRLAIGELDLDRVVEAAAHREPVSALPRRLVASLRDGVQMLCDAGPAMTPFALDVEELVRGVLAVAGRDRVMVARFETCPTRGLLRWDGEALPYRLPPPGQPALVLSDLGALKVNGSRPALSEWLHFETTLRRQGSRLTVFFPGNPKRLPAALRGALRIVALDRATGVRQALRAGHRG